jgi:hypothetical protein
VEVAGEAIQGVVMSEDLAAAEQVLEDSVV